MKPRDNMDEIGSVGLFRAAVIFALVLVAAPFLVWALLRW